MSHGIASQLRIVTVRCWLCLRVRRFSIHPKTIGANMTSLLPQIAADYIGSINDHDPDAFFALFVEDAVVHDNGRDFRTLAEIKQWSSREIFDAEVTLEVFDVQDKHD